MVILDLTTIIKKYRKEIIKRKIRLIELKERVCKKIIVKEKSFRFFNSGIQ